MSSPDRPRIASRDRGSPVGAIDVGTNTVLLLAARAGSDGALVVLGERSVSARLGEGLARTGRLDERALERGLDALRRCVAELEDLGVPRARTRAVGTAVLRRAADAQRFLERARRELGLEVEVLSEEEEARLGHAAVVAEGAAPRTLVIDVGGGSTELVGEGGALRLSVPVGALVLSERFALDARTRVEREAALGELEHELAATFRAFPAGAASAPGAEVCLLGGTALNLGCLAAGLSAFDHRSAEGRVVPASAAAEAARRLVRLAPEERLALPIEADRAAILPAGLACAAAALERLGARSARVSGKGLRYGVARELLAALGG